MRNLKHITVRVVAVLAVFALAATLATAVQAQGLVVDPTATQILKRMTDYLGSIEQFSLHTQNTVEDMLDSGQRVDLEVSTNVIVKRPSMLFAERSDHGVKQIFHYDGKTLTLYDQPKNAYATEAAPRTLAGMLDFARQSLGLVIPASDLVYPNAFELLTQNLVSATVVGKAVVGGIACDHLAFRRPDVDFQIWVAEDDPPLPCKMVVTDTGTPALLSVMTRISDFNAAPAVPDDRFTFVAPIGAQPVTFMRLE
jgi:hypothetical protein